MCGPRLGLPGSRNHRLRPPLSGWHISVVQSQQYLVKVTWEVLVPEKRVNDGGFLEEEEGTSPSPGPGDMASAECSCCRPPAWATAELGHMAHGRAVWCSPVSSRQLLLTPPVEPALGSQKTVA